MSFNKEELIDGLRELKVGIIKNWKKLAKESQKRDDFIAFKNGELIPVIEKIAIVGGDSIQFCKNNDLETLLQLLVEIYKSADEVKAFYIDGYLGENKDDHEHISYTLPSRIAFEYLYILGSLAVKENNIEAIETILTRTFILPEKYNARAGSLTLVMSHPSYKFHSGEGTQIVFFEEAKKIITSNKIFFDWFDQDEEVALSSLTRFDFLRGFYLFSHRDQFVWYDNFKRYYNNRVIPIINQIVSDPEFNKLFPNHKKQNLIKFLQHVDKSHNFTRDGLGWDTGLWQDLESLKDEGEN